MTEEEIKNRFLTRYSKFDPADESQFTIGESRRAHGRNLIARGLSIISECDLVCIGAGGKGSGEYFDFARALDKPVLPLPFVGGAAKDIWIRNHQELAGEYGTEVGELNKWEDADLSQMEQSRIEKVARSCIAAMRACTRLRCLVFIPFSTEYQWVFDQIIVPACELVGADPIRLDLSARVGDINSSFVNELHRSDCAIAVVSNQSPNVLYEVGYAHASEIPVILLSEDPGSRSPETQLTFYVRNHRTVWYLSNANERGAALATQELSKLLTNIRRNPELI
jgi:hypothetical protein